MTQAKIAQLNRARDAAIKLTARIELSLVGLETDDREAEQQNTRDLESAFDGVLKETLITIAFLQGG